MHGHRRVPHRMAMLSSVRLTERAASAASYIRPNPSVSASMPQLPHALLLKRAASRATLACAPPLLASASFSQVILIARPVRCVV